MALQDKTNRDSEVINRIANSSVFEGAETLIRLLRYLADKSHEESGESVKEYQIATEVLGRRSDFDPRFDSCVRTQVTRLRSKLLEYSLTEGKDDPYVVKIPRGAYRLVTVPARGTDAQHAAGSPGEESETAEGHEGDEEALAAPGETPKDRQSKWIVALAFTTVSALAFGFWAFFAHPASSSSMQAGVDPIVASFWKGFTSNGQGPLVVYSNARFARGRDGSVHSYDSKVDPPSSMLDHYTGVGEVLAVHELDGVFIPQHVSMHVTRGALLSIDYAENNSLILIGRPAEGLSVDSLVSLRYFDFQDVSQGARAGDVGVRNRHPEGKEQEFYLKSPDLPITDDYAIIARVPGLNAQHKILLAAGTTTIGTEAAVRYLCHADTLRELTEKLGSQYADENFEAVLYLKIARGVPVNIELVALRKYPAGVN